MTRAAAVAALLALAMVAACDGTAPSTAPAAPASAPAPTGPTPVPAPPLPTPSVVADDVFTDFTSPSGNIGCYLADGSARCDIAERSWEPPPRPADCELDWGQGVVLGGGPASFVCAGDTALGGRTVLPYGASVVAGDLRCTSERSGVRCEDVRSGHGFELSRQAYRLR